MGYDIKQIHGIFNESKQNKSLQQEEEINLFLDDLDTFYFSDDGVMNDADKSLIYYVAGYIAKASLNNCEDCNDIISPGKVPLFLEMESTDDTGESTVEVKEAFTAAVSRGGLTKPSDYLYITSVHASVLYNHIFKDNELKNSLLATENPRITFIESFCKLVENKEFSAPLIHVKCIKGHSHIKYIRRTAFTIFNISAKNYVTKLNYEVRNSGINKRTKKRSESSRKIKKLQSK